jgi:tRNA-splicing endonuclease subunit Sen34
VKRLRCDHRIVGALMGSLPRYPQQNGFYGLPLLLMAEETALVLHNGNHDPPPSFSFSDPSL